MTMMKTTEKSTRKQNETSGDEGLLRLTSLAIISLTVVGLAAAAQASAEVRVTSVNGTSQSGGEPLVQHSSIASGETIEVEDDGVASIFAANTVVTLCNGAALIFNTEMQDGAQVLDISRGEIKASAAPRTGGSRLEIHTPVAIATLLGTAVHISVNPETGDSTITSLEHQVRVENVEEGVEGHVILSPGDQVVVRSKSAPDEVAKVDPGTFSRSSSCLDDAEVRRTAVLIEQMTLRSLTMASITAMDIPASPDEVPSVGMGHEPIFAGLSTRGTGRFDPIDDTGCAGSCADEPGGNSFPTVSVDTLPVVPRPLPPPVAP